MRSVSTPIHFESRRGIQILVLVLLSYGIPFISDAHVQRNIAAQAELDTESGFYKEILAGKTIFLPISGCEVGLDKQVIHLVYLVQNHTCRKLHIWFECKNTNFFLNQTER